MSKRICYNCGGDQADTAEHVIARTLIPEPRPNNLVTVPACRQCNESVSKDEEYLRDRLVAAVGGPDFKHTPVWDVAWRSMQRPQAKGKKLGFFKDVIEFPLAFQTKNGLSNMGVELEKHRVDRVVEKIVRGFYFYRFSKPLGEVEFEVDMLSSINPQGDRKALIRLLENIQRSPTWAQNFGPDTHAICALDEDDDRAGLWSFKFFGQHILVALVGPNSYFENNKA